MRIWFKFLIGAAIGLLLGIFLPVPNRDEPSLLFQINDFMLSAGRYVLFPLIFFSAAVAVNELRQEKRLVRVFVRSLVYMAIATFLMVLIGALLILFFSPEPIPLTTRHESALIFKSWNETLLNLIPKNSFQILTGGADFLLPLYVLSFLIGLHFHFDTRATQPAVTLFDSLSRIFYHFNSFVVEIMGWLMIVLSAAWLVQLRMIQDIQLYFQVFLVLILASAIVILGIIPLILFFFGGKENPYRWIFGMLGAGISAFFSGDNFFSLSPMTHLSRENLGVPRKVGAMNLPFFAMFGRSGTAMTSTIAFFVILKSYTTYEITLDQIFWTIGFAFLLSFVLPSVPGLGAYINLSLLCSLYGKALDTGYVNLQPIVPILVSFATLLDVYVASMCSFLVAKKEGLNKPVSNKLIV